MARRPCLLLLGSLALACPLPGGLLAQVLAFVVRAPRRLDWRCRPARRAATSGSRPLSGSPVAEEEEEEEEQEVDFVRQAAEQLAALERAAATGEAQALFRLGRVLRKGGRWVQPDPERAFELLQAAADQNHAKAQCLTGLMLMQGEGTLMDEEAALVYLSMAAEGGILKAQYHVALLYYSGAGSDEEGKKDTLSTAYWFKKAADNGHPDAQYRLGGMLLTEDGIRKNETWAAQYFKMAAEQGHTKAQEGLGLMLRFGVGVDQDSREAIEWLTRAAEQGDAESCYTLGCMFRQGEGVAKDAAAAVRWFTAAGDRGHATAAAELGVMHLTGEGTPLDEEGSAYWFAQADALEAKSASAAGRGMEGEEEEEAAYNEAPLEPLREAAVEGHLPAWARRAPY